MQYQSQLTIKQIQCDDCRNWFDSPRQRRICPVCTYERKKKFQREYSKREYRKRKDATYKHTSANRQVPAGKYVVVETPVKLPHLELAVLESTDIYRYLKNDGLPIGAVLEDANGLLFKITCCPGDKQLRLKEIGTQS